MRLPGFLFKHRYKSLLPVFRRGKESELRAILWQPREPKIKYMDVTVSILQKIQPPSGEEESLKIERVYSTWNFDLVIFYTPWSDGKLPYHPLIFYRNKKKVAGVILPWNELRGYLTKRAENQICELGKIWVLLSMKMQGFLKK